MRKIIIAAIAVLVFSSAHAATYEWGNTFTTRTLVGDFSRYQGGVPVYISWEGGAPSFTEYTDPNPFDSYYDISIYFNGAFTYLFGCNQFEAHCGQSDTVNQVFVVDAMYPEIFGGGSAACYGNCNNDDPLRIFLSVPDGFSLVDPSAVTAVPEPSTWVMLMLGFAGIGFMVYRRKSKPALMAA